MSQDAGPTYVHQIRELTPLIRARRAWSEANVRMAPDVRSALGAIGAFSMTAPAVLGGLGVSLPVEVAAFEETAYADPAVSWVIGNSNAIAGITARMEEHQARLVLADRAAVYAFGLAPVGRAEPRPGGMLVSGRWPVVSGCHEASWFLLASTIHDDEQPRIVNGVPQVRFAVVPAAEVEILDTWSDAIAIRGSGSDAVQVRGVFVPDAMLVNMVEPLRTPVPTLMAGAGPRLSLLQAAIVLGVARAAIEATIAQAGARVSIVNNVGWRELPSVQDSVATVDVEIYAARTALFSLVDDIWSLVEYGRPIPPHLRARTHALADHATNVCRAGVSRLFSTGSIDVLHGGHGLEQALRDIHAFSVQWERYRRLHFEAGRVLLGAAPRDPLF